MHTLSANINLFVPALETGRKTSLWKAFLPFFTASANEFYIYLQCTHVFYPAMSKYPKQLRNCPENCRNNHQINIKLITRTLSFIV